MFDEQEQFLLHQIRILLKQLDERQTKQKDEEKPENKDDRYRTLLQLSCKNIWEFDPLTQMVSITCQDGRVIINSFRMLMQGVNAQDHKRIKEAVHRIMLGESEKEYFSYQRECRSGEIRFYEVGAHAYWVNGNLHIIGVTRSVRAMEERIERVLHEQEKFDLLLSMANMYIWEYDVGKREFSANQSLCDKLGLPMRSYTVEQLNELLQIHQMPVLLERIERKALSEHAVIHLKNIQTSFDLIFETNFKGLPDKNGNIKVVLGTMNDITEKELLKTSASRDPLIGCFNRRSGDMTLVSTFQKFQNGEDFYTIIFFDVDDFKKVNDRYGHDMGDYVLRHVCEQIEKEIRSSDMLFRWGGDEFLLICSGISKENIYAYIERLRRLIESSDFIFDGNRVQVTLSIGAAYYYKSDHDYQDALKRADSSVYKAKLAGRNKVCVLK